MKPDGLICRRAHLKRRVDALLCLPRQRRLERATRIVHTPLVAARETKELRDWVDGRVDGRGG